MEKFFSIHTVAVISVVCTFGLIAYRPDLADKVTPLSTAVITGYFAYLTPKGNDQPPKK